VSEWGHPPTGGHRGRGKSGLELRRKRVCGDTHSLESVEEGIGQDIERSECARGTHRLERTGGGTSWDMGKIE